MLHTECVCSTAPAPRTRARQQVQGRFGRWLAHSLPVRLAVGADDEQIAGLQSALVHAAGGDGQTERMLRQHGAEIAAGAEHPPSGVKLAPDLGKPARDGRGDGGHVFLNLTSRATSAVARLAVTRGLAASLASFG